MVKFRKGTKVTVTRGSSKGKHGVVHANTREPGARSLPIVNLSGGGRRPFFNSELKKRVVNKTKKRC